MDGESIAFIQSTVSKESPSSSLSFDAISVLVVDDDTTCLTIVAAILKKFKYQVVTVKHPSDALSALRAKGFAFDLVVADVHMPDMNGFQLQQAIAQEFNLPVVLMTADDKEHTATKGLESGAAFFILKPVLPDDLRDLWQFAAMKNQSTSQVAVEDNPLLAEDKMVSDETVAANSYASGSDDSPKSKNDTKTKSPKKASCHERKDENSNSNSNSHPHSQSPSSSSQKRPKVIWTNSLHNRFLEAIRSIGLERAVPKKILEVMNVPGLTRENVASHLQKYRIFLRRVSDASCKIQYAADRGVSRSLRQSFDFAKSPRAAMMNFNRISIAPSFQNPGRQFPGPVFTKPDEASSSSSSLVSQLGFGQSRLLGDKRGWIRPRIEDPSRINYNDSLFVQNSFQPGGSIQGQAMPACLDSSLAGPGVLNPGPGFEILSTIGTGDDEHLANYVGYNLSDLQQFAHEFGRKGKFLGLVTRDLPGDDQLQSNGPGVPNESVDLKTTSNSFAVGNHGGELLSDIITDYYQRVHTHQSRPFTPTNLSELDFLSNQHLPVAALCDHLDNTLTDQVKIQNQPQFLQQNEGGENIASCGPYSVASFWDNAIPSLDQPFVQSNMQQPALPCSQGLAYCQVSDDGPSLLNKTTFVPKIIQANKAAPNSMEFASFPHHPNGTSLLMNPPPEHGGSGNGDFLESLFAPFEVDQNFNGL